MRRDLFLTPRCLAATCTVLTLLGGAPALAQMNFSESGSAAPLEITAEKGLELAQDARTVIGRGNASAARNGVTITADVLIAHYRNKSETPADSAALLPRPGTPAGKDGGKPSRPAPGGAAGSGKAEGQGGSEIWRVEAVGHVVIRSQTQTAYSDRADYNIDSAVVVLTGTGLKLTSPTDTITARDSLEYWEQKQQAVARGNAVAIRAEKKVSADVLVTQFGPDQTGKMEVKRALAYDHVVLTTLKDKVTGDRADYNTASGLANVYGAVRISRDGNQLAGGFAQVNMNTGISTLTPGGDGRVKGIVQPAAKDKR